MWSVTSTPPIPIGHSPTPKRRLQHRGLGPVTVKQTKIIWSSSVKHQTEPPIRISGIFALIRVDYLPSSSGGRRLFFADYAVLPCEI